jgi:Tol biopolymer transport system component
VAFQTSVPQEDIFVVRPDGTGLRRLTRDSHRDRHPRWSPDGSRLLFQSDRGGRYEIWSLRPDGGGLEQVTRTTGKSPTTYPVWSPDGRRIACNVAAVGTALLDLSPPLGQRRLVPLPPIARGGQLFNAVSWSPDGAWLAGQGDPRSAPGIFLYSLATKSYTRLTDRGQVPRWLPDGRTLLFRDEGRILALDVRTRRVREVLAPPPNSSFIAHGVAPDGRTLFVSRTTEEGDVCLLTLQKPV